MGKYTAFISYRHVEPDMTIAKKLHTLLETYHIPSALRKEGKNKLGRVFRDQEELPLSTDLGSEIHFALENSDWLIVICSPALLESKWCMKEIDTFISMGKRDKILAVLVSGNPDTSFPEQLKTIEIDGVIKEIEPLAANIVSSDLKGSLKLLKDEKLRLFARILNVDYDDLKQRERHRTRKTRTMIFASAFTLISMFTGYVLYKNHEIKLERNSALIAESKWLTKSAKEQIIANNPTLAMQLALEALPSKISNPDRPFIQTAQDVLYNALFAKSQEGYKVLSTIQLENKRLNYFEMNHISDELYLFEENQNFLDVYDITTGEYVKTIEDSLTLERMSYAKEKSEHQYVLDHYNHLFENTYIMKSMVLDNQDKNDPKDAYNDDYLVLENGGDLTGIHLHELYDGTIRHSYVYEPETSGYSDEVKGFGPSYDGKFIYGQSSQNIVLFKASDATILKNIVPEDVDGYLFETSVISDMLSKIAFCTKGGNGYIYDYVSDSFVKLENENHSVDTMMFNHDSSKVLTLNKTGNTCDIYLCETGEMVDSFTCEFEMDKVSYGRLKAYNGGTYSDDLIILRGNGIYQILINDTLKSNVAINYVPNQGAWRNFYNATTISTSGKTLWNLDRDNSNNAKVNVVATDLESGEVIGTFASNTNYVNCYGLVSKGNYLINYYPEGSTNIIKCYDGDSAELLFEMIPEIDGETNFKINTLFMSEDASKFVICTTGNHSQITCYEMESQNLLWSIDYPMIEGEYARNLKRVEETSKGLQLIFGYAKTCDSVEIINLKTGEMINQEVFEDKYNNPYSQLNIDNCYHFLGRDVTIENQTLIDFETKEDIIYFGKEVEIKASSDDGSKLVLIFPNVADNASNAKCDIVVLNQVNSQSLIDYCIELLDGKELTQTQKQQYFLE